MKICTVVGARPQFVKASCVSRALANVAGVQELLIHTGQHYDSNMSDIFFRELGIPAPHLNLNIGSGGHGVQTGAMLQALERVFIVERPDWVLVYGDTNSTLAGTLAAVKLHIPVAHVESGVRAFNKKMPEEINRILTDHSASLLFTPTAAARQQLEKEGIPADIIEVVGDVMYDVALYFADIAEQRSNIQQRLGLKSNEYILSTVHRAENTDSPERLSAIFEGLRRVSAEIPVVMPLHPRTRAVMDRMKSRHQTLGVTLTDPLGYLDMVMLERNALLVATDSGGVQREAYFHGRPCVTFRAETEWIELVEMGWNTLLPPVSGQQVAEGILKHIGTTGMAGYPYGRGDSAVRIVRRLAQ